MNRRALVYIDNIPVYVPLQTTVIQACDKVGLNVPRFCYHDLLGIAGNCRICLIEVERSPKPQVACGLPVLNQIKIYTGTPIVKKAREGVLEFLLLNHPLDCPICDQGGECDLQNQTIKYGSARGRFFKSKRGVEDKGFGPVVKTVITRCIHCTRCVRFAVDVAGIGDLGTLIRGSQIEIGTYTVKALTSEVSGNIIDLCPVGALTLKPHAFKTRPWEIKFIKSIDITDCLGSHIIIESKKSKPIRVVPRPCIEINEEWLTDKARFAYEGFLKNRLSFSYYYKNDTFNKFYSLKKINKTLSKFMQAQIDVNIIFGRNIDYNTLNIGAIFCKQIGWDIITENLDKLYLTLPCFFQSTSTLNILKKTYFCLILGINPRAEASLVNLRLNKQTKLGKIKPVCIGNPCDLQYKVNNLGLQLNHLLTLTWGIHNISRYISKNPVIIYGDTITRREDAHSSLTLAFITQIAQFKKNCLNILRFPIGSNTIGNAFLGLSYPNSLIASIKGNNTINYYVGLQDLNILKKIKNKFVFENTHYPDIKDKPSFLLPIQTAYEKTGLHINFEGRLQKSVSFLRFGKEPLSFTKNSEKIKEWLKSKSYRKLLFSSFSSYDIQKLSLVNKNLKCFTTPLQILLGEIYITDQVTSASLTLSKISGIIRQSHWPFKI